MLPLQRAAHHLAFARQHGFQCRRMASRLGDQQFRGYYSALLVREGDEVKIWEETVNVAAP
jgi:hypothetical protein